MSDIFRAHEILNLVRNIKVKQKKLNINFSGPTLKDLDNMKIEAEAIIAECERLHRISEELKLSLSEELRLRLRLENELGRLQEEKYAQIIKEHSFDEFKLELDLKELIDKHVLCIHSGRYYDNE